MSRDASPFAGVLLLFLLAGCAPAPSRPAPEGEATGTEVLTLGAVLPMSGTLADWGRSATQGEELAVERLKAQGLPVTMLAPEDDQGKPGEAATAYRRAVQLGHAVAVVGPLTSTTATAVGAASDDLRVPFVSPSATADSLTRDYAAAFRACYADSFQGRVLADYAADDLHAKRAVLVFSEGDAYSQGLADTFRARFTAAGGTVVDVEIDPKAREFKPEVRAIGAQAPPPDVVVLTQDYPVAAAFLRAARNGGVTAPALAGDAIDSPEFFALAGDAATDLYATSHWSVDDDSPIVMAFTRDFQAKFGRPPDVAAALTYDATLLIGEAWRARSASQTLAEALASLKSVEGVTGTISLGPDRNPVKRVVVLRAEAGRFGFTKAIAP